MFIILIKLLPILLLFLLGIALRRFGILDRGGADRLLRLVAYVGIPALTLTSVGQAELRAEFALLPLTVVLTVLATATIAWGVGRRLRLARPTLGVFVIGPSIMNLAVEFPFVLAVWGQEGFVRFMFLDFGNGLVVLTFLYALAGWFGGRARGAGEIFRHLARFPPIWALAAALTINVSGLGLNETLAQALNGIGTISILLVMVALGVHFEPRRVRSALILYPILLRIGLGLALGWLWVSLLDLDGLTRSLVLFGAVAPVGFNTLVFASLEKLDEEFAAGVVSLSVLISLFYLPVAALLLAAPH